MHDKAIETISHVISGLVGSLRLGNLPAVDLADLETMFGRNEDGTAQVWYVGVGHAAGPSRGHVAALRAAVDLQRQADMGD